jgi:hypothetical protein
LVPRRFVIRGLDDMDLYINGIDDGGTYDGTGGSLAYCGGPARIGGGIGHFFDGVIDELYFYDRGLSATEVHEIYLADCGPDFPSTVINIDASVYGDPGQSHPTVDLENRKNKLRFPHRRYQAF